MDRRDADLAAYYDQEAAVRATRELHPERRFDTWPGPTDWEYQWAVVRVRPRRPGGTAR